MSKKTKEFLFFEELLNLLRRYRVNIIHLCENEDLKSMNEQFGINLTSNDLPMPILSFEFPDKTFIQEFGGETSPDEYIEFINENDDNERYCFNSFNSDSSREKYDLFTAAKAVDDAFPAGDYHLDQRQNIALNNLKDTVFHYTHTDDHPGDQK